MWRTPGSTRYAQLVTGRATTLASTSMVSSGANAVLTLRSLVAVKFSALAVPVTDVVELPDCSVISTDPPAPGS